MRQRNIGLLFLSYLVYLIGEFVRLPNVNIFFYPVLFSTGSQELHHFWDMNTEACDLLLAVCSLE